MMSEDNRKYPPMNPIHKATWLAALRSGKYNQRQGSLYREAQHNVLTDNPKPAGYCCLGVAASACLGVRDDDLRNAPYIKDDALAAALGMEPGGERGTVQEKCGEMNDDDELSFVQIATWIERNL